MNEQQAHKPILVTGATGFIGQRLVKRLRDDGHSVRALVLPSEPLPPDWEGGVEIVRGDIAERSSVQAAVDGAQSVHHLAAIVGDWGAESLFQRVTVNGTRHVFESAVEAGIPVVLASSIVVYGSRLGRETCSEDRPHGEPYGPYSRAKQTQEKMAHEFIEQRGADIRMVRPGNVYGPGSKPWVEEAGKVLLSGAPALVDGGGQNAGLAYVDNVADIFARAAAPGIASGEIFNACDAEPVTWRRYFSDLAGIVGAPPPRSMPGWVAWPIATTLEAFWRLLRRAERPALTREALHLIASDHDVPVDKARSVLGHEPVVGYATGIARIAESKSRH